tara:strand:+ start:353 stop:805 length:453 start_codon:yes stop_codon:yes gene_type:complete
MGEENSGENEPVNLRERALRHFDVGNMKLDSGNPGEAIDEYRAAIELWDNDARFYNNLGIAFRQQEELGHGEENLRRAIELDPGYRDAYSNLGLLLLDREMYQDAIASFSSALEIDPTFWYAYSGRGLAFWALGKKDEALSDYEKLKGLR